MATTTQLSAGKLVLSWSPPEDTGGRTDITYSVECQRCEGNVCQPCGEKIRYEPASTGLTDAKVTVSELEAHLNYTFTVEARTGVSVFASQATPRSNKPPSTSALTTSLHYTGECCWYEAYYLCCGDDRCYLWGSGSSVESCCRSEMNSQIFSGLQLYMLYFLRFSTTTYVDSLHSVLRSTQDYQYATGWEDPHQLEPFLGCIPPTTRPVPTRSLWT